ncbi:MAG: hypothetical protein DMG58_24050 [Acidobacteria bacterium]|nr:MAG: hypothetical protein DMG58_24050 [Acidobacteriota bacterium]
MNRKKSADKQKESVQKKDWKALEIVHPDAAGIDVGGSEHWVAVSPDRDPEPIGEQYVFVRLDQLLTLYERSK